jgi:hypothetical protein
MPLPEREIVRGLALVLLNSLIIPVCAPTDVGIKTTCILAYPPFGCSVIGIPSPFKNEGTNPGEAESEEIVTAVPPEFTRENTTGELAVSTVWGLKLKLVGDEARLPALGCCCTTVRDTGLECIAPVPVPVMVSKYVPAGTFEPAETVNVTAPPDAMTDWLKDTVIPEGALL